MTESPRPVLGDDYSDATRCPAVVRLSWTYPGMAQRRERIRCKRRRGHAGRTHVAYLKGWNLPWSGGPPTVVVRWVA